MVFLVLACKRNAASFVLFSLLRLSVGLKPVPSGSGSLGEYKELYGNALPNFSSGPPGVKVKNRFQLLDSNSEHDDDDE